MEGKAQILMNREKCRGIKLALFVDQTSPYGVYLPQTLDDDAKGLVVKLAEVSKNIFKVRLGEYELVNGVYWNSVQRQKFRGTEVDRETYDQIDSLISNEMKRLDSQSETGVA